MKEVSLYLCGNLWQNLGDHEAGWGLVRYLRSSDPQVRTAAEAFLVEAGPRSIRLLQSAVSLGALETAVAADCLVTLLTITARDSSGHESGSDGFTYDC
jgi:hypothetical protein